MKKEKTKTIEIFFKDLNKEKQHEIIMQIDEMTAGSITPLAYINIEEVDY
jgi:hypothetical protein